MSSDRSSEHLNTMLDAAEKALGEFDRDIAKLQKERQTVADVVRRLRAVQAGTDADSEPVRAPYKSQKKIILEACGSTDDLWLDSKTIGDLAQKLTGEAINPNSLYSQISNLTKDGLLVRDGRRVALAERVKSAPSRT